MKITTSSSWPDRARFLSAFALLLTAPTLAHAAGAGGGFQWETNIQKIANSFTGPMAFYTTLLAVVVGASMYYWGHHESSAIVKFLAFIVILGSIVMGSTTLAAAFGWTGAVV